MSLLDAIVMAADQPVATPATDYTPQFLTIAGTLLAAFFSTVIAQYFFAPWLEVRKQILMAKANERERLAQAARDCIHSLRRLKLVKTAMVGTVNFDRHWSKAMLTFREQLGPPENVFPVTHIDLKSPMSNLAVAAGWTLQVVITRGTVDKAPIEEALKICHHLSKSISPTTFPPNRMFHALRGLWLHKKMMNPIKDLAFGE